MVTVGKLEETLLKDLQIFKSESIDTLDNVIVGMNLSKTLSNCQEDTSKISDVIDKLSTIKEILASFRIGIDSTKNPQKIWIAWEKTGSTQKYYYNNEENLTEKMLCFILMSLNKEISQRLSVVEASFSGYIYFCEKIKDRLHHIIANYITA